MSETCAAPLLRHAVIAGANKCGTTSLFRYLAAHPGVRGSRVKETGFFLRDRGAQSEALAAYLQNFAASDSLENRVLLEATPRYLEMGRAVARRIHGLIPETRLIFLLRDPVERFQSFYRSKQGFSDFEVSRLTFAEFSQRALSEAKSLEDEDSDQGQSTPFGRELLKGRYVVYLRNYLEIFPPSSLRILYLEHLRDRPVSAMTDACHFLALDPAMYENFQFNVENKSRIHRHAGLRTFATRTNRRLEPMLNRAPWLRRAARFGYGLLNTPRTDSAHGIATADVEMLRDYYAPFNRDLAQLVSQLRLAPCAPVWAQLPSVGDSTRRTSLGS